MPDALLPCAVLQQRRGATMSVIYTCVGQKHSDHLVISSCLLLQSLQQKNLELLTVVRTLGAEKEDEKASVEAGKEEERKLVKEELSAIQAENARVQVIHPIHALSASIYLLSLLLPGELLRCPSRCADPCGHCICLVASLVLTCPEISVP